MIPKKILLATLAAILMASAGYWLLAPREKEVVTFVTRIAPAERILAVNGRIRPRLQVEIRPALVGQLIDLPFDVGDRVEEGEILAQIDDGPETAAIEEVEAAVQSQQATLAQARRDLARFEALGDLVARREVEQLRLAVAEGEWELSRRRASALQLRELHDRRVLTAPFSGVILERPVDLGQTVGLESVIYRLADLTSPEVNVEVDEIYAAEIRPGTRATVSLQGQDLLLGAEVRYVEPRVDPATGARDVRLTLSDEARDAPSGLTVTVNLLIETRDHAISIPRSAIIQSGIDAKIRVVGVDNIVIERAISFVDWPAEQVIVTRGVEPGELVLVDPESAQPGEKVRSVE